MVWRIPRCPAMVMAVVALITTKLSAEPLPSDLVAALRRNAEATDNLVVDWSCRRTPAVSEAETLRDIGMPDNVFFFRLGAARLARRGALFRGLHKGWTLDDSGGFQPSPRVIAFDGRLLYIGSETFVPGAKTLGHLQQCVLDKPGGLVPLELNYFEALGIKSFGKENTSGSQPMSEILALIDDGAIVSRVGDAQSGDHRVGEVALKSGSSEIAFRLDPALNFAVVTREERDLTGRLLFRVTNEAFERLDDPLIWLPKVCRLEYHTWFSVAAGAAPKPLFIDELQAAFTRNFAREDEEFTIDYKHRPGVMVVDRTLPESPQQESGAVDYFVPPDPSDLQRAIDSALHGKPFVPSNAPTFTWIIIINVILVALVCIGGIARKLRRVGR